jgi:hypothetical protein
MTSLFVQVLLILVTINVARTRRIKTTWGLQQLRWRLWLSIVGMIVGLVLPMLGPAQPGSPLAIASITLTLSSVFVLSKTLYRKTDLNRQSENNLASLSSADDLTSQHGRPARGKAIEIALVAIFIAAVLVVGFFAGIASDKTSTHATRHVDRAFDRVSNRVPTIDDPDTYTVVNFTAPPPGGESRDKKEIFTFRHNGNIVTAYCGGANVVFDKNDASYHEISSCGDMVPGTQWKMDRAGTSLSTSYDYKLADGTPATMYLRFGIMEEHQ